MDAQGMIAWLPAGAIAGWLSGKLMKVGGVGLVGDVLVGIAGAFIGGWLAELLGIGMGGGLIVSSVIATAGAAILLLVLRMINRD